MMTSLKSPAELAGPLDRHNVLGLLDDTDAGQVATRVKADAALLGLGDVATDAAEADLVLDLHQCIDESPHIDGISLQQMERNALCALGTDARQPAELVDEVLDHAFIHLSSLCPDHDTQAHCVRQSGPTAPTGRVRRSPCRQVRAQ